MSELLELLRGWGYINTKSNCPKKNKQKLERKIMPKEKNDKLSERDKRSLELRAQLIAEGLLRPMTPKIAITPKPIQKKFIPHSRCKKNQFNRSQPEIQNLQSVNRLRLFACFAEKK